MEEGSCSSEGRSGWIIDAPASRPDVSREETNLGIEDWLTKHCRKSNLTEGEEQVYKLLTAVDDWWSFKVETRSGTRKRRAGLYINRCKDRYRHAKGENESEGFYASVVQNKKSSIRAGRAQAR